MPATPTVDLDSLTPGARRILDTASTLFYEQGIHAVGVDTIAAESGVTKRTLYDRFGSKDALVAAYLQSRDRRWRSMIATRLDEGGADPVSRVLVPFDVLPLWLDECARGCSFINAFGELHDADHPGRDVIVEEKTWLLDHFRTTLTHAGIAEPEPLAVQLLSLHEGAIVAYSIAGAAGAAEAAHAAARSLVELALVGQGTR
ncbi:MULTISPECIES: TetR/AcrR family transcriptional regulator [unclassified Nocardioides]|uniref:TetR/AcrR family transcriptional regulator n=1 Tax=unclassified Nocardioides TaxID=2615069 RepID=UPI0006FF8FD2|nr:MULTISPECIES: TetR/AcrR family transcriptional regulator [unclassified Nocardioides]KQY57297.1 TetR family transcriptional regulator [Nocardioides sp. Root140]KQZ68810.1 TetR family transcriptional regulator [Nocardioides sp. Root151]